MLKLKTFQLLCVAGLLSAATLTSSFSKSSNNDLIVAYIVKLPDGKEAYVRGQECAEWYASSRGGTIIGQALVESYKAYWCFTDSIPQ